MLVVPLYPSRICRQVRAGQGRAGQGRKGQRQRESSCIKTWEKDIEQQNLDLFNNSSPVGFN
jgi:ribosomal protein L15